MEDDDDELYDPPWSDDLYALPTDEQAIYNAAAALADLPVEPSPFTRETAPSAARKRRHDKLAAARLEPENEDWLIQQIRMEQIAKTDRLVVNGKLKPWDPDEYMRQLQRNAIDAGAPLTQTELIARTDYGYSAWLQENSTDRPTRPKRDRTTLCWELITTPQDRQCGYVGRSGYFCDLYSEMSLTVICKVCGKVPAQVCLDHFDLVLEAIERELLTCTAETPGSHQIVFIVEGRADVASS